MLCVVSVQARPITASTIFAEQAVITRPGPLPVPEDFPFDPGFDIYPDGTTTFDFDAIYADISPSDITDYYVAPVASGGNDSNSGLTPLLPKRGIDAAMTTAASASTPWVRINIAAGDYEYLDHPGSGGVAGKNVIFKVVSGEVRTGPFQKGTSLTWTNTSGTTFSTTRSNAVGVRDNNIVDQFNDATRYTSAASQAACESTPYSWFLSGTTLYVNTNGVAPGANHFILIGVQNTVFSSDYVWIFDGGPGGSISLIGGSTGCLRCTAGGVNQKLYWRNLWLRYATNNNNLYSYGVPYSLLLGGGGSGSHQDILNYHAESGRTPKVIEIGVTCHGAGTNGAGNNNCSTIHDGGAIIRVRGAYRFADSPVVADVNDGTYSWNIACDAKDSKKGDSTSTDASWLVSAGTAVMYLDNCTYGVGGSDSAFDLSVGAGATMKTRRMAQGTTSVSGTITTY